jgi:hypothetical protein
MLSRFVNLRQNCALATRLFVIAQACVNDERVGSVVARVIHNWFGAQVGLEF